MYLTRKIAYLGVLFLLCAGFLFSEETPLPDKYFFVEEFFLFGNPFSSEDPSFFEDDSPGDEPLLADESPSDDETLLAEEASPGDEPLLSEGSTPGDETLLSEEFPPDEDILLTEESPLDEETLLAEEIPSVKEAPPSEEPMSFEDYLAEGGFFFEAPPLVYEVPEFIYEIRSFDAIFPNFSRGQKMMAFNNDGIKHFFEKDGSPVLLPHQNSGIDLLSSVMSKDPSHIIEAMVVVPYNERELDILDIYNALGKIGNIQNHTVLYGGKDVNILEETTRLESAKSRKSIPDPPQVSTLPYSETMYLRFKDAYYGNLYIRGDVSMSLYGIIYNMTNFTDVRYFLIPVIRAERLSIIIYLEPIKEGVLVYSMSGLYLPGFIADKVNLTPAINRRINVLLRWIVDSLRNQEAITVKRENET